MKANLSFCVLFPPGHSNLSFSCETVDKKSIRASIYILRTLLSCSFHKLNNCRSTEIWICTIKIISKIKRINSKWFKINWTQVLVYFFIPVHSRRQTKKNVGTFFSVKGTSLILHSMLPTNSSFKTVWNLQFSSRIKYFCIFIVITVVKKLFLRVSSYCY